jgi:hypothetical protein
VSALHFNENAKRDVRKTKHGVEQYSVSYPKGRKGEPVVKDIKKLSRRLVSNGNKKHWSCGKVPAS